MSNIRCRYCNKLKANITASCSDPKCNNKKKANWEYELKRKTI